MQNAKNLLWPLKGELTELQKEQWGSSKTITPTSPSSRSAPAAQNWNHSQCQQWVPCIIHAQRSAWSFSLDLGVELCWKRGRGHAHCELAEMWQLGQGQSHLFLHSQQLFPLPRAVGLTLDLPQGLSRGGLSFSFSFAW